jgi:hypothetical protein
MDEQRVQHDDSAGQGIDRNRRRAGHLSIRGLHQHHDPQSAVRLAAAAAGETVSHPGGRPQLTGPA